MNNSAKFVYAFLTCAAGVATAAPVRADWIRLDLAPKYANCVTVKDSQGNPVPAESGPYFECEMNADGTVAGQSSDHLTVVDSDAVRGCKAIGARLPTTQEILALGSSFGSFADVKTDFWTTSVNGAMGRVAQPLLQYREIQLGYAGDPYVVGVEIGNSWVNMLQPVLCLKP